jgi:DNA modification methylase
MPIYRGEDCEIYQADAADCLEDLAYRGEFVHAVITSPPYFQKFDYQAGDDEIGKEELLADYMGRFTQIFELLYQVTVPGGAFFLNLGETWNNYSPVRAHLRQIKQSSQFDGRRQLQPGIREKSALMVPWQVAQVAIDAGWMLRDTIVWIKGSGRKTNSDRPQNVWEPIFYFRKPDRESGRPYAAYWDEEWLPGNAISIYPKGDPDHPCPFAPELVKLLILASVPIGGWVLDPFGGIGSVAVEALEQGRRAISIDLSEIYTYKAIRRVQDGRRQLNLFNQLEKI